MRLRNVAFLFKIEVDISSTVHTFVSLVEAGGCKYHEVAKENSKTVDRVANATVVIS